MASLLNRLRNWPSLAINSTRKKTPEQTVLFYRDFAGFTGGHLKVWDYFNHVYHSHSHQPCIAFSANSLWNDTNPWLAIREQTLPTWNPHQADIIFLAGMDWSILNEAQRYSPPKPIINLIQHVRHADPKEPLYQYLNHPAVRISVSPQVTEALKSTQRVNGPIFTISNGIDLETLPAPKPWEARDYDILIMGIKQPTLAKEVENHLKIFGQRVIILTHPQPRPAFLELLNNAKVSLLLPNKTEGFYLPALEGFALGTLVICPDCIGNRSFCVPNQNCLQPNYTIESLLHTLQQALHMQPEQRQSLQEIAHNTAQQHSLLKERQSFLEILQQIGAIWSSRFQ